MGTIEISELLSFAVPFIIAYSVWMHNQIVNMKIKIAVNTANDQSVAKEIAALREDVKALAGEVHQVLQKK